jgi:hypothetical protein
MTAYRVLGLALVVVAIVTALHKNWIAAAFCAVVAIFCLAGKTGTTKKEDDRG